MCSFNCYRASRFLVLCLINMNELCSAFLSCWSHVYLNTRTCEDRFTLLVYLHKTISSTYFHMTASHWKVKAVSTHYNFLIPFQTWSLDLYYFWLLLIVYMYVGSLDYLLIRWHGKQTRLKSWFENSWNNAGKYWVSISRS